MQPGGHQRRLGRLRADVDVNSINQCAPGLFRVRNDGLLRRLGCVSGSSTRSDDCGPVRWPAAGGASHSSVSARRYIPLLGTNLMSRGNNSAKRFAIPRSMAPGFGVVGDGRAVILHEPVSGADVPVLVAEMPPMPARGPHGEQIDASVAMALSAGMASTFDLQGGPFLAGWSARRSDARQVEITAGADVFVTTNGHLPSRWLELVAERQEVVIVCGVGVITSGQAPDPAAFPDGQAATARIAWRTQIGQKPGYHLLDLRPAGFALPVLSFPADELLARGPLQQWGFEHLGERNPSQPLPLSDRLVVSLHTGPADVDVFDVGEGGVGQLKSTALTPITGMKGAANRPAWADAVAAQHGCYMLLATTRNAMKAAPSDLLLSSWCAIARIVDLAPALDRSSDGDIG